MALIRSRWEKDRAPRVYVHLNAGRSPQSVRDSWQSGKTQDRSPYGYVYAGKYLPLSYSVDCHEGRWQRVLRRSLNHLLGFDVVHAFRNRRLANKSDIIWTHTEREFLAIALLMRLKLIGSVPLLGQAVWLWDKWPRISAARRRFYAWLMRKVTLLTTHSPENATYAARVVHRDVFCVPFGVDPFSLRRRSDLVHAEERDVVAVGNDLDRDWATLAKTMRSMPHLTLTVLSRRRAARRAFRYLDNVEVVEARLVDQLQTHLQSARTVVVPLRRNLHVSGITAVLEALYLGKSVVVTRSAGLEAYLGNTVNYAEPGSASSLTRAISRSRDRGESEGSLAELVARGLTARDYGLRHVYLTRYIFGDESSIKLATAFEQVPDP